MAQGDLQVSNEIGRSTLIKIAQLDLQAAYKEWLWIWDYYMILICLSFHSLSFLAAMDESQTDLFSSDADMELIDKLEVWSQNIQPISFHIEESTSGKIE